MQNDGNQLSNFGFVLNKIFSAYTGNDESISFKRLGNGYYCIKVEVNQDLLVFIVM